MQRVIFRHLFLCRVLKNLCFPFEPLIENFNKNKKLFLSNFIKVDAIIRVLEDISVKDGKIDYFRFFIQ